MKLLPTLHIPARLAAVKEYYTVPKSEGIRDEDGKNWRENQQQG
jgi:hypothetical protein